MGYLGIKSRHLSDWIDNGNAKFSGMMARFSTCSAKGAVGLMTNLPFYYQYHPIPNSHPLIIRDAFVVKMLLLNNYSLFHWRLLYMLCSVLS